jgi:uncharacterized membrane protein YagU involved in acid resistance
MLLLSGKKIVVTRFIWSVLFSILFAMHVCTVCRQLRLFTIKSVPNFVSIF